jgi:polysaccharide biosynthesis transport protein
MASNAEDNQGAIELNSYWLALKRRWLPLVAVSTTVFGLVSLATVMQKPTYEAEGKLLLSKKDRVSSLTDLTEQNREISGLTQSSNPLDTEAEILRSVPLVQKTINTLNLKDGKNRPLTIDQFLNQLKAKGIRGTDVLEVSYRGSSPRESAAIVNVLMQSYLDNNIRVNRAEATAARKFITKQLPDVEARVAAAEVDLQRFKEANQVVDLEEEAKVAVSDLSKLSEAATQAQAQLGDVSSRSQSIQAQIGLTPSQAVTLTTLSQSASAQEVLKQYREVQDQLAVQRTRYRAGHPEIAALARKEAALSQQLQTRILQALGGGKELIADQDLQVGALKQNLTEDLVKTEAERWGLVSRVSTLNAAIANYQARMGLLPRLEKRQRELERRLQVARVTYEQLLKRLQEVEVAENQNVGNARIVSKAIEPTRPIAPRVPLNLALGVVAGVMAGVLAAFILDAIDKSVKTAEEAEKLTDYPLLSVIPLVSSKHQGRDRSDPSALPVRDFPFSSIRTNFEMLQTTLGFTLSDQPLKVILVTSAISGEGKSFIAANLATATAQMGRRVLLIDADMRQPSQHTIWQQINLKGLSDVLVEQATLDEVMTEVHPNLSLLTSGTLPPNPIALLDSQRFAALIASVQQTYDFVILDTPALNLVPDGLTIGKFVDGVLFVVRPQVADSGDVTQAKTLLSQSCHRVLGMVVNGCMPGKKSGYGYHPLPDITPQVMPELLVGDQIKH